MTQLIVGKAGPLKASSAKAVRALMQKRASEGTIEHPDVATLGAVVSKVKVIVHAPKAEAFFKQRNKT